MLLLLLLRTAQAPRAAFSSPVLDRRTIVPPRARRPRSSTAAPASSANLGRRHLSVEAHLPLRDRRQRRHHHHFHRGWRTATSRMVGGNRYGTRTGRPIHGQLRAAMRRDGDGDGVTRGVAMGRSGGHDGRRIDVGGISARPAGGSPHPLTHTPGLAWGEPYNLLAPGSSHGRQAAPPCPSRRHENWCPSLRLPPNIPQTRRCAELSTDEEALH